MNEVYADVIVPVPINAAFTYAVPPDMAEGIKQGSRVLVPFGARHYYTGIVEFVHNRRPELQEVKKIAAVLDPYPIVRHAQLKLWHWLADYYLCGIGDVMKAAVPAGLKVESETMVELSTDAAPEDIAALRPADAEIAVLLRDKGKMSPRQIAKETGRNVEPAVARLVEQGVLAVSERLIERYRAVKQTFVEPAIERGDTGAFIAAIFGLKRSPKQERAFMTLLEMSRFNRAAEAIVPVERGALLDRCAADWTTIRQLEKK
ncbi:MAG: hypothetical protein K2F77_02875, partial [Muribaculaceae bacterium]|nr:hypothetical protein [Muribaculaceae bacterium]